MYIKKYFNEKSEEESTMLVHSRDNMIFLIVFIHLSCLCYPSVYLSTCSIYLCIDTCVLCFP